MAFNQCPRTLSGMSPVRNAVHVTISGGTQQGEPTALDAGIMSAGRTYNFLKQDKVTRWWRLANDYSLEVHGQEYMMRYDPVLMTVAVISHRR